MEGPSRNLDSTKPQKIHDRYGIDTLNKGFYTRNGKKHSDEDYVLSPVRGMALLSLLFFYWEVLLLLFTQGKMEENLVYLLASSVLAAMLVSLVSGIFPNITVNYVLSMCVKLGAVLLYVGQLVYHQMTGSFFSVFSGFSGYGWSEDILPALLECWWQVLLFLLPLVVSVAVYVMFYQMDDDILGYGRRNGMCYLIVILVAVLAYVSLILSINLNNNAKNPVHEIFYQQEADYNARMENFGAFMSMTKDILWKIFD